MPRSCIASSSTRSLEDTYGRQFRGASAGEIDGQRWPMTRGTCARIRQTADQRRADAPWYAARGPAGKSAAECAGAMPVRRARSSTPSSVPLSETVAIAQIRLPVDRCRPYWSSRSSPGFRRDLRIDRGGDAPRSAARRRPARLHARSPGATMRWGYDPQEQAARTSLGMGEDDIDVHDQWACESIGAIQGPHPGAPGHQRRRS
jgi:hypothetical protein